MTTNSQLFEAADAAIRSIKSGEETIMTFATALNRPADARALSDKDCRRIENKLNWTRESISRQVYRLARIMLGMLDDVKS